MIINNCEITILVKGRPITEFFHRGQTFIEGRGGSNYEIAFRNHNPFSVEVVLSVDGLSVTDGKLAGPQSSGYVVKANDSLTVPGWTLDNSAVAAFAFAEQKGGSYVEQATGSSANKGVIGGMVFKEKVRAPVSIPVWNSQYFPLNAGVVTLNAGMVGPTYNGVMRQQYGTPLSVNTMNVSASAASAAYAAASPYQETSMREAPAGAYVSQVEPVEQTLGTAFGEQTNFNTDTVNFERGVIRSMFNTSVSSA